MAFFFGRGTPKNTYLGVDIGTSSIKVAEVERNDEARLKNYGILETCGYLTKENAALQTSSLRLLEPEVARHLHLLLRRMGTRTKRAIASLPTFSTFTTLVEFPKMPPEDVARAMPYQSQKYIPVPVSSVSIEWFPVGERTLENGVVMQQFFLVSTPKEVIEKYQKIFARAGLELMGLELENASMARILTVTMDHPVLIVDIGSRSTSFGIAKKGILQFVAQTDFSGGSLTEVLARGLGVTPQRAELFKIQRGLLAAGGEQELSTLMKPIIDVIINEAGRARNNFEKSYGEAVKGFMLSGQSAKLLGLSDYFSAETGLPLERISPFDMVAYPKTLAPFVNELAETLTVALGLSLRGWS